VFISWLGGEGECSVLGGECELWEVRACMCEGEVKSVDAA